MAGRETADLYHAFKQAQQLSYAAELQVGGPPITSECLIMHPFAVYCKWHKV